MKNFATLFQGGVGADTGIEAAGLTHRFGIEFDPAIAAVARLNGFEAVCADVTEPGLAERLLERYGRVDAMHASPPCPSFSVAKTGGAETPEDIALARATLHFFEVFLPGVVTLENVWGYRQSVSWREVLAPGLIRLGYWPNVAHMNAADMGVAQTRKRMIVWAVRGRQHVPPPPQTHTENPCGVGLFGTQAARWIGWHEAIEDLLPSCPDSALADWQKKRLPKDITEHLLSLTGNTSGVQAAPMVGYQRSSEPAATVHTHSNGSSPRAVLLSQDYAQSNTSETRSAQSFSKEDPAPSVRASASNAAYLRAVLIDGQNGGRDTIANLGPESPALTITANMGARGILPRALEGGAQVRTAQLTARCLARFQSFLDSYRLPMLAEVPKRRLKKHAAFLERIGYVAETHPLVEEWLRCDTAMALRTIGNACPPLLMQRLYEHLARAVKAG